MTLKKAQIYSRIKAHEEQWTLKLFLCKSYESKFQWKHNKSFQNKMAHWYLHQTDITLLYVSEISIKFKFYAHEPFRNS